MVVAEKISPKAPSSKSSKGGKTASKTRVRRALKKKK